MIRTRASPPTRNSPCFLQGSPRFLVDYPVIESSFSLCLFSLVRSVPHRRPPRPTQSPEHPPACSPEFESVGSGVRWADGVRAGGEGGPGPRVPAPFPGKTSLSHRTVPGPSLKSSCRRRQGSFVTVPSSSQWTWGTLAQGSQGVTPGCSGHSSLERGIWDACSGRASEGNPRACAGRAFPEARGP